MKIYVASPYSHINKAIQEDRYADAMKYTAELFKLGYYAISPIVYGHEMARIYELPTDAAWWEGFNFWLMDSCDVVHVYMMPGWEESKGIKEEIEYAKSQGIPIIYVPEK